MSKFETKEELLNSIGNYFTSIDAGNLSMDDLENLVEKTRELYERALILRFKAYDEKVFGEKKLQIETEVIPETQVKNNILEEEIIENKILQEDVFKDNVLSSQVVDPVFDFSIFDENVDETPMGTDVNDEVELKENTEPNQELESIEELTTNLTPQTITEETKKIEDGQNELNEEFKEIHNEKNKQDEVFSSFTNSNIPELTEEEEDVFKNILISDDSLASKLMFTKLYTLLGSFGFNERVQITQELFNGSNEDFNQAIDVLDNLENMNAAKKQLLFYMHLNKWDLEKQSTIEFIQKIQRRYL